MIVLAFDTATADTVVALELPGTAPLTAVHRPAPGERPGHAEHLLALARGLLAAAGLGFAAVDRFGVGTGPGTFTGLRIGVATARALAQGSGRELVGVGTLEALARGAAAAAPGHAALGCLDARRGEAYARGWAADGSPAQAAPQAVPPAGLAALVPAGAAPWTAAGDGAVRFRPALEAAGVRVPPDDDPRHHVDGAVLCALARAAAPAERDALEPQYVRAPDAVPSHLR